MQMEATRVKRTISVFTLAMINVAAIGSVKNWPLTAELGMASIFYLALATIVKVCRAMYCNHKTLLILHIRKSCAQAQSYMDTKI